MCIIIGREKEIEELERRCRSNRPEFVAVYGRRRVGKTFLINEVMRDNMVFHHTGLSPYDRKRKVTLKDSSWHGRQQPAKVVVGGLLHAGATA